MLKTHHKFPTSRALRGKMKICLVTTFPPSRGGLSEYGYHLASELQRNPLLSLTVLADQLPGAEPELESFSVLRCWSTDDPHSPRRLLSVVRKLDPDVVWFNLVFSTFGRHPLAAFTGLASPLLTRISGYYTHVTLHHLMDTVDMRDAGVRFGHLYRIAGRIATRMLLRSNSVSVTLPAYRRILLEKYRGRNIHLRAHGIFSGRPEYPDFSRRGYPEHRILAFGKWGTYKRLELLLEAFQLVRDRLPQVKLVIAGGDHPHAAGYVASVAKKYEADSQIEFTGYLAEQEIPIIFRDASVVVMPYSSSTGSSGVAHLACAYGVPIISADIPDFRQMAQEEGLAIDFYDTGDVRNLADRLVDLLQSSEQQEAMAVQNFGAALRMTMPQIVFQYLRNFDVARRTKVLRTVHRLRRLPQWLPIESILSSAISRKLLAWTQRPALLHPFPQDLSAQPEEKVSLPDGDGRHGGHLKLTRSSIDTDCISAWTDALGGKALR